MQDMGGDLLTFDWCCPAFAGSLTGRVTNHDLLSEGFRDRANPGTLIMIAAVGAVTRTEKMGWGESEMG